HILVRCLVLIYSMLNEDKKESAREFRKLLWLIGSFIRREREKAGYTLEHLAFSVDMDASILSKYENGKRAMTLKTFYKIIRGLGKTPEEVFTALVLKGAPAENLPPNTLPPVKEQQLRLQVNSKLGAGVADALSSEEVYRLNEMIRLASRREVRKSEIRDAVGLKTYTRAFNRLLDLARQAGLIRLKYPESLHHKNQRYLV